MCICIFPRSDSPLNIGTLLKRVAPADCMQLLILPKPKCYYKVIYPPQISQAEVYQNQKIWLANTITLLFHLVFTPLPIQKNAPKEPLGITILTVFFFFNPQQRSCCRDFSTSAMWAAAKTNLPADRMSAEGSVQPTLKKTEKQKKNETLQTGHERPSVV